VSATHRHVWVTLKCAKNLKIMTDNVTVDIEDLQDIINDHPLGDLGNDFEYTLKFLSDNNQLFMINR
jgi:hypothetical protein